MTAPAVALVVIGAATVTSSLCRIVDAVEAAAGRGRRERATTA